MASLAKAFNVADMQALAARALPLPIREYLEGGADDEWTLARNRGVFDEWVLAQHTMVDVTGVDPGADLIGFRSAMPLMLSPTGMSQLFHASGETAVARAAAAAGVPYGLSTMATTSIETVAATGADRYFQLYLFRDRGLTKALLERAAANGYGALCLTVDTAIAGNRERDLKSGMIMPPRFTLGSLMSFVAHPRWSFGALRNRSFQLANVVDHVGDIGRGGTSVIDYVNAQFDRSATWKDVEWLRSQWAGKLVIKGAIMPGDCASAVACGGDAIMVSNHGGRQLDTAIATIDALPAIADAVDGRVELLIDGGVRRGTDIVKAIALGAKAVCVGRPVLWGLAVAGQQGVEHVLALLREELDLAMALCGAPTVEAMTRDLIAGHSNG